MHAKELERYKQLLVEKPRELLTESTGTVVPAAGRVEGDPIDNANADAEAELDEQQL